MQPSIAARLQLIFTDSIHFFFRHIVQIGSLCLPFILLATGFQYVLTAAYPESAMANLSARMFGLIIYPIYTAALIHFMARRARNERPGNRELILAALPQWGPLLMLNVIMSMLLFLGFLLFVIPCVWLTIRMSFAEIYLVLFGMSPREALEKSGQATTGHFWMIFTILALMFGPFFILMVAFMNMIVAMPESALIKLTFMISLFFMEIFVHVVIFRTFMEVTAGESSEE